MKKSVFLLLGAWVLLTVSSFAGTMSSQEQQELLDMINYLNGNGDTELSTAIDQHDHTKCGTAIALTFFNRQSDFTGEYAAKVADLPPRPTLTNNYNTPGGHFKIHYNTIGTDAVYLADTDVDPADGIPDYINGIATAADSVWRAEIEGLGYPTPLSDGFNGGDSRVDIYIKNLGSSYYGVTYPDTTGLQYYAQSVAAYLVLDNDYNIYPYNLSSALSSRLAAARVTMAHEFFHVIHYTLDYTEFETQGTMDALPWWEMTAVWMEEKVFDDVNDYYYYLHSYLDYPYQGLRLVFGNPLHQYGAGIFPLYIDEKWGSDIIKNTWQKCRDHGQGSQFLQSLDEAINEYTSGTDSLLTAFNEFATWNFYTGDRAARAPDGVGYSEAANYAMIPDSVIFTINMTDNFIDTLRWVLPGWPDVLSTGDDITFFKNHMPQNLGTHYLQLNNVEFVVDSVFSYRFSSPAYTWSFTHLDYPNNPIYEMPILSSEVTSSKKFEFDPEGVDRIVGVITPVVENWYADPNFSKYFEYNLFFNNQFDVIEDSITNIQMTFGPNPVLWEDDNSYVTFYITDVDPVESDSKSLDIEINIYNSAGEKVYHQETTDILEQYSPIETVWSLENSEGVKVTGGVYFAVMDITSSDGKISKSTVHKIALIK